MIKNVQVINFVLKWLLKDMERIMFMFANHESQKVGGVLEIVNANAVCVGTVNVLRRAQMITISGAEGMEKHAVSVGRIAANSVVREREVTVFAAEEEHDN